MSPFPPAPYIEDPEDCPEPTCRHWTGTGATTCPPVRWPPDRVGPIARDDERDRRMADLYSAWDNPFRRSRRRN